MKYVSLKAIGDTLGVYSGDASKFLKCCNISHIPADWVPHESCDAGPVRVGQLTTSLTF